MIVHLHKPHKKAAKEELYLHSTELYPDDKIKVFTTLYNMVIV